MNTDLTICIPCHNSLSTIKIVLNALNFQDIYPKIIVLDNGSKDGTFEALITMVNNKYFPELNIELTHFGKVTRTKFQNLDLVRHKLCDMVSTRYIMFIDSDVLIPPYSIGPMLEQLEHDNRIGMLGLKYDVNTNHVKLGATILRTELVKNLKWKRTDDECQCLCAAKEVLVKGFTVQHYTKTSARHLRAF